MRGADRIHVSLHAAALACVQAATPDAKVAATRSAVAAWRRGDLSVQAGVHPDVRRIDAPGRPPRPRLVDPRTLAPRGLGTPAGRAALVHAVAHIEFNAIDLAWDAVYRFRDMPPAFYDDWVAVADDEARHFGLLAERLAGYGHGYGDFDAHDGLWRMAMRTSHDCLARMALVPRVLEARGLDVTPGMIGRLRAVGDVATVAILETILREEIAHVAAGTRWFHWCCERVGREPQASFASLLAEYLPGPVKGPLNREARLAAGFSAAELAWLEPAA